MRTLLPEIACIGSGAVAVRDSKNPVQAPLRFSSTAFATFCAC
ncbi:DUF397 domain-containing protein [Streptomyces angustmyceticus]